MAALIGTMAKQPLRGGMHVLFFALVTIAVATFIALLLTGPRALWAGWRNRQAERKRRPAGAVTAPRSVGPAGPAPVKPSAAQDGIKLQLADDRWQLWQGWAWIADIQVMITNTASSRVVTLTRFDLESDPGRFWADRPRPTPEEVTALVHETINREPLNPHMDLKPGESRIIRVVRHAALPYPAREGKPYCEFVVTDAEGKIHALPLTAHLPPGSCHLPDLMRLRNLAMEGRVLREHIQNQAGSNGMPPGPDQTGRYEAWLNRTGRALKPWPGVQAEFQAHRTATTDRDAARLAQRTQMLEEILQALEEQGATA